MIKRIITLNKFAYARRDKQIRPKAGSVANENNYLTAFSRTKVVFVTGVIATVAAEFRSIVKL